MSKNMMKNSLLKFKPIQKFINGIGKEVKRYFGKDKGCVIGLGDDGIFYGLGLYQWLKKSNKKLTFTFMEPTGEGLEEEKVKGRKVLIVDNDIITGKSYKRAMEVMKAKKERLKIKGIKFAVLCDRTGLADFSVEGYSAFAPWGLEKIDGTDLKIIAALFEDGRKSFVEIAKKTRLSPVGVKNRVEKLTEEGILKIQGLLNIEKCYSVSANVEIEADQKTITRLIEKFEKSPIVYHLVKTSGRYNLLIGIIGPNLVSIENFIAKEIRKEPGVKHIEVNVGELPIIPKGWSPPIV
jgi:DNA-binding Lrp family transcriptional regulator/hypoxanthine-guanine phosphoribosyltransferase